MELKPVPFPIVEGNMYIGLFSLSADPFYSTTSGTEDDTTVSELTERDLVAVDFVLFGYREQRSSLDKMIKFEEIYKVEFFRLLG